MFSNDNKTGFFSNNRRRLKKRFFYQSFTQGIDLISQWDRQEPGCPQALRLVDYYAKVAIERGDPELYRLLNTVITGKMRNLFEGKEGAQYITNYPYAIVALDKIRKIREGTRSFKEEHKEILDAAKLKARKSYQPIPFET
ncbi:hypothetical protein F1643_05145 [Azospirillum sp. INR13]|uniref:hypothetical protein n=1 Tax=Azospirillum sp. INR13 TaxID=2596919 RepID=UPI001892782B|nr:hypothetical protein [Azospirillum sp. INR13]MBF5093961.1 hypothetical protein [Azospirillum sp. INR13]